MVNSILHQTKTIEFSNIIGKLAINRNGPLQYCFFIKFYQILLSLAIFEFLTNVHHGVYFRKCINV